MHDELVNSRLTDMRAKALIHDAFLEEKGARLFGSFDLEPSGPFVPGAIPSLGIRNSVDKSYALTVLIGMRVMACSNGVLYVEKGVQVSRKHTSG